jgi:hypothetical protein
MAFAPLILVLAACDEPAAPSETPAQADTPAQSTSAGAWFKDVAVASGVDHVYKSGKAERYFIPEAMGGAAALFDMDGDADLDLYVTSGGPCLNSDSPCNPNRLYRNRGDGTFDDVSADSGADRQGYDMGVACADYDNDGDVDLYVTSFGPNALLRNDGNAHFTDVSAEAGVDHDAWGASAAFLDYDRDGDLDLYVANYLVWSADQDLVCYGYRGQPDYCGPTSYEAPAQDVLYRNDGDGTFTDVTRHALRDEYTGNGLGVICGDFTGNGYPDIFVANDGMRDQLWANQGDGTFLDVGLVYGCAYDNDGQPKAGMGLVAADMNEDGTLDVIVCNLGTESDSLYLNEGEYFRDATAAAGLGAASRPFTRFGMGLIDFDNDGYLDLYQANGRIARQALSYADDPYAEPNLVMRGGPGPRFERFKPDGGTDAPLIHTSRGAAFGDIDNDGAVDVVVVNRDGPTYVLRNVAPDRGHWIMFRAVEEHGRDALGATITMQFGDRRISRDVRAASSYFTSNDPRVHVGLGESDAVTNVTVTWPDATTETFGDFQANRIVELVRGAGTPQP